MNKIIYLDYAAATPLDPKVFKVMQPYYADKFYNPSAIYLSAAAVKADLEDARAKVAKVIGARPGEIIFTAGGTEANNLAIKGVMDIYPGAKALVSAIEHESVLHPVQHYKHSLVPVGKSGLVDLDEMDRLITDDIVLISVLYANNEVGTIQKIRQISQAADVIRRQRRKNGNKMPLYVHTDACQAGNYLDLHISRLGVDLMTINGGKIYGPKQSGVLFAASHVRLKPQIEGGGQERGFRSGTENIAQAVGMAQAIKLAQENRQAAAKNMKDLQEYFISRLLEAIPGVIINGSTKQRLPNNVHITIPGQDNERLIFAMDNEGILAAAGSACSAASQEPSHVLRAMGLSDKEAQASLRLTMGRQTTKGDIDYVVQTLADLMR